MKSDRIGRAGVLALAVVGLLAVSWVLPPAVHQARRLCPVRPDGVTEASAYANFARRYGVDCSVCHTSVPQLNVTGYKFRTAGYRMPDEIGNDAKWGNWGDNASIRTQENFNVSAAVGGNPPTNGFSNGGLEMYPWEGAIGKYMATNTEVDVSAGKTPSSLVGNSKAVTAPATNVTTKGTPGTVSMSSLNMLATFPINSDSFLTTRVGIFGASQGYGASDRMIDNSVQVFSEAFAPTPSQLQPGGTGSHGFTYNSMAPSVEGLELAYNWKDTHVAFQIANGYNSYNGSVYQGEDNRLKDFGVFVNQLIGENAIAAYFYNGSTSYGNNQATIVNGIYGAEGSSSQNPGNNWIDNYMRGELYGTVKFLKDDMLNLLVGVCDGVDHSYDRNTNNASDQFHSMGGFALLENVQHIFGQQLTTGLRYGTSRASTSTAGNRVSDVDLEFAVPISYSKFAVDLQTQRTQQVGTSDLTADAAAFQWQIMF